MQLLMLVLCRPFLDIMILLFQILDKYKYIFEYHLKRLIKPNFVYLRRTNLKLSISLYHATNSTILSKSSGSKFSVPPIGPTKNRNT
ncbi:MAG: hypothetical protein JWO44_953 [Bacteroidetes bacterium]|nr:hypothetical protein [Bacteroidota bacterium]